MSTALRSRSRRRGFPLLRLISIAMILASAGLFVYELLQFTGRENRLPAGISVAGVPVGNLGLEEARVTVEQAYARPITLYYNDNPINLNPDTVGFRLSIESMLADANSASETDGGPWVRFIQYLLGQENVDTRDIPIIADYQTPALEAELREIARRYDFASDTASIDTQTLTTFAGESSYNLDVQAALPLVEEALQRPDNRVIDLPVRGGSGSRPDISTLEEMILSYLDAQGFIYDGQNSVASIYILDLLTGEEINIQGDVAYSAASTSKVPIMLELYRTLDREPTDDDAFLMANSLLCSANSSSNLIMEQLIGGGDMVTGLRRVTDTAQYLGATGTFIASQYGEGVANQQFVYIEKPELDINTQFNTQPDPFNQTTAEDMGLLFTLIHDCAEYESGLMVAYPDGEYTQQECRQMIELMSGLELGRLLEAGISPGIRISHKNGWTGGTVGNAGIVYPPNGHNYIISVFLWEQTDATSFRLWPLLEDISRAAWNYFYPEGAMLTRRSDIPDVARDCANYLPPYGQVNLEDIDSWRNQ